MEFTQESSSRQALQVLSCCLRSLYTVISVCFMSGEDCACHFLRRSPCMGFFGEGVPSQSWSDMITHIAVWPTFSPQENPEISRPTHVLGWLLAHIIAQSAGLEVRSLLSDLTIQSH